MKSDLEKLRYIVVEKKVFVKGSMSKCKKCRFYLFRFLVYFASLILLASAILLRKLITNPRTGAVSEGILFGPKYKKHKKTKSSILDI